MNKAKAVSRLDGKRFLREALAAEQAVLAVQLEMSARSITHNGVMGEVNEQHFLNVLRRYLPQRYEVDRGIVIDSNGATSDQIDIIIFDHQYTPTLLDQQLHRFIPAEAVYGVLEVKPTISKQYLEYAADKASSVRNLERTSMPIASAGGQLPPKQLFPILAGIVAQTAEWAEGLRADAFTAHLLSLAGSRAIDCGVALSDRSFDSCDGNLVLGAPGHGLAAFLFRLLHRLQSLGTVPAVDWNKYGAVISDDGT